MQVLTSNFKQNIRKLMWVGVGQIGVNLQTISHRVYILTQNTVYVWCELGHNKVSSLEAIEVIVSKLYFCTGLIIIKRVKGSFLRNGL